MKGKILGTGIISGDDGQRYSFEASDIANLDGRNPENLAGAEVEFEIDGNAAKSIYLTTNSMNLGGLQGKLMSNDTQGIRFKLLAAAVLYVCSGVVSIIPFLGWVLGSICMLVAFVLHILGVIALNRASESKTLLRNFILTIVVAIGTVIVMVGGVVIFFDGFINGGTIVIGVLGVIGCIAILAFQLLYARELAYVTGQKFILWSAYLSILAALTIAIVIGYLFSIAAFVLYIVGLVKFQTITKRTESDKMPWF